METTSYDVLVIILSVTLAIFLILSIIAVSYLLKILKNIRSITEKAERITDNVEATSQYIKSSSQGGFVGLLTSIVESFRGDNNESNGK